jgi:hypothetical protein
MVSCTQQTQRIRARKARRDGSKSKRFARAHGTPTFAVHPEGYDPKAADAKPIEVKSVEAKPAAAKPAAQ